MRLLSRLVLGAGAIVAAKVIKRARAISFHNRVVLITGGSRGLGLVLARRLVGEGARLMLVARDACELGRASRELRQRGGIVETFAADATDPTTATEAVATTVGTLGRLDMLINNAGTIVVGPLENMTEEDYAAAMDIHFWAPLRFMNAALPDLKKTRGRIVNISSIGGKIAVPHLAPYTASKFALAGVSDAYRAELANAGVKVTSVYPGLMRTGSHIQALFKGQRDKEFAWFSLGAATPFTSISAERAARKIIRAARYGDPELIITLQARMAVLANAIFPGSAAQVSKLVNASLPAAGPAGEAEPGWKARGSFPPAAITALPDEASRNNNEIEPRHNGFH